MLDQLLNAIADDDRDLVKRLIEADSGLLAQRLSEAKLFVRNVHHYLYAGDTALRLAADAHRVEIVRLLLAAGADPNAAKSHRHTAPLHCAASGYINGSDWNETRQLETIRCLLDSGADINIQDASGASPLHKAVRTRCAAAVRLLLQSGADPVQKNKFGSTPFHLAVQNTGRGGSGAEVAKEAQREIIRTFLALGISPTVEDGNGESVLDWARSGSVREILLSLEVT